MAAPKWNPHTSREVTQQGQHPDRGDEVKAREKARDIQRAKGLKALLAARAAAAAKGRGGGGGGGGAPVDRRVKGVEYYRAGKFKTKGLKASATKQVDAAIAEKLRQSNVSRGVLGADYQNAIAELQRVRNDSMAGAVKSGAEDQGRLNNSALNRGMGYGQGAGTNESSLLNKYADIKAGIDNKLADDTGRQAYDYNRSLGDLNEADRVVANNRASEIDAMYRSLYGESWDRYLAKQGINMGAVQQRNSARAMAQGK
jgi:hypothetical protein